MYRDEYECGCETPLTGALLNTSGCAVIENLLKANASNKS